jgi:hypothetical protein
MALASARLIELGSTAYADTDLLAVDDFCLGASALAQLLAEQQHIADIDRVLKLHSTALGVLL